MVNRAKKWERRKYKNLINEKSFLEKQKSFYIVFEGLLFGEKNKNLIKIADTTFKFFAKPGRSKVQSQ